MNTEDIISLYKMSFEAHFRLVSVHPWSGGNGRISRLVMNMLQSEAVPGGCSGSRRLILFHKFYAGRT